MRRRRSLLTCALLLALSLAPGSSAAQTSWAQPQIKVVVAAGLMSRDVATFHPNDPLTRAALEDLVAGLTDTPALPVTSPSTPVTMTGLDTRLVGALGLLGTAQLFQEAAKSAGLAPPARFGSESVARLLSLRVNHPAGQDDLE